MIKSRITPHTKTLIDVILSNKADLITVCTVIPSALSDHDTVCCARKMNNLKEPYKTITCRDYRNYDSSSLRNDLKGDCFQAVYTEDNPNKAWNLFKNIVTEKFNLHAPLISKRIKGKISPWLNRDIKKEMNSRDALQRKFRKTRSRTDFKNFKKKVQ